MKIIIQKDEDGRVSLIHEWEPGHNHFIGWIEGDSDDLESIFYGDSAVLEKFLGGDGVKFVLEEEEKGTKKRVHLE